MSERAYQPVFEREPFEGEPERRTREFIFMMTNLLETAIASRQSGADAEDFGVHQARATKYINQFWPSDEPLSLGFGEPVQVFKADGLHEVRINDDIKTTISFQAHRHAGFGARGALFVNDASGESVYLQQPLKTNLDFVER